MSSIHLNGVSRHYGAFVAVDDVSLDVEQGEFVTILGPSGSGKTTVLSMIAGLNRPTGGSIHIGGRDVTALGIDPLGAALAADGEGKVWVRPEGASVWSPAMIEGVGPISAIASTGWVQSMPLPRDIRWVRQSVMPLPSLEAFTRDPSDEIPATAASPSPSLRWP